MVEMVIMKTLKLSWGKVDKGKYVIRRHNKKVNQKYTLFRYHYQKC